MGIRVKELIEVPEAYSLKAYDMRYVGKSVCNVHVNYSSIKLVMAGG